MKWPSIVVMSATPLVLGSMWLGSLEARVSEMRKELDMLQQISADVSAVREGQTAIKDAVQSLESRLLAKGIVGPPRPYSVRPM